MLQICAPGTDLRVIDQHGDRSMGSVRVIEDRRCLIDVENSDGGRGSFVYSADSRTWQLDPEGDPIWEKLGYDTEGSYRYVFATRE